MSIKTINAPTVPDASSGQAHAITLCTTVTRDRADGEVQILSQACSLALRSVSRPMTPELPGELTIGERRILRNELAAFMAGEWRGALVLERLLLGSEGRAVHLEVRITPVDERERRDLSDLLGDRSDPDGGRELAASYAAELHNAWQSRCGGTLPARFLEDLNTTRPPVLKLAGVAAPAAARPPLLGVRRQRLPRNASAVTTATEQRRSNMPTSENALHGEDARLQQALQSDPDGSPAQLAERTGLSEQRLRQSWQRLYFSGTVRRYPPPSEGQLRQALLQAARALHPLAGADATPEGEQEHAGEQWRTTKVLNAEIHDAREVLIRIESLLNASEQVQRDVPAITADCEIPPPLGYARRVQVPKALLIDAITTAAAALAGDSNDQEHDALVSLHSTLQSWAGERFDIAGVEAATASRRIGNAVIRDAGNPSEQDLWRLVRCVEHADSLASVTDHAGKPALL